MFLYLLYICVMQSVCADLVPIVISIITLCEGANLSVYLFHKTVLASQKISCVREPTPATSIVLSVSICQSVCTFVLCIVPGSY